MIKLKKELNNYVIKLHKKLLNEDLLNENVYILYDDIKICGYVVYKIINNIVKIEWIYAPNYGKIFMNKLERKFKKENYKKILLNLSIDPTENINDVMKRINFYISLQYKVYDIKFRKKYGPLLYMQKVF
jgi:hypothetical protein